ncbi:MAG: CDP-alcohol phosphatidyltransferase family protein [Alphaproteobacteria bacterium]|nr:CDP-alcohol phosphatidyltransferase family protein [Alphaproteobacteria bacterium]
MADVHAKGGLGASPQGPPGAAPRLRDPLDQRLARFIVRPLVHTAITPNHLTTLRLLLGLGACAAYGVGGNLWFVIGSLLFLLSTLMDHADGELARLSGKSSKIGHFYDLSADIAVQVLLFIAIGIGLRDTWIGASGLPLGLLAGAAVAALFVVCQALETRLGGKQAGLPRLGGFDTEDALYIIAPVTWVGGLEVLLIVAAVGAPLFLAWLLWHHRRVIFVRTA